MLFVAGTWLLSNNCVMQYLLTDHLSSVVAVTDNLGTLLEDSRYMPYVSPPVFGWVLFTAM